MIKTVESIMPHVSLQVDQYSCFANLLSSGIYQKKKIISNTKIFILE